MPRATATEPPPSDDEGGKTEFADLGCDEGNSAVDECGLGSEVVVVLR